MTEFVTPNLIIHFVNVSSQSRFFNTQGLFFTGTDIYKFLIWLPKLYVPNIRQKQFLNRSRIVLNTEYATNLRTINLKIKMLGHKFCTLHLLFSSSNLHLKQRKYILQNWKGCSFLLQKLKELVSSLCYLNHFFLFRCFPLSLTQFCLDKYLSYILTFVTPYWDCLCDKFQKQFGNLHIVIFVSPSTLQNFIFPLQKYFEETKHLWIIQLLCSLIWSQYYFVTITHFSIILFFHLSRSCVNFWSTHPLGVQRMIILMKILRN